MIKRILIIAFILLAFAGLAFAYTGNNPKDVDATRPASTELANVYDDQARQTRRVLTKQWAIANTAAAYTLTSSDGFLKVNATGGAIKVTLPAVADVSSAEYFKYYMVMKSDNSANPVELDGDGADISGVANILATNQYEIIAVYGDGTEWFVLKQDAFDADTLGGYTATNSPSAVNQIPVVGASASLDLHKLTTVNLNASPTANSNTIWHAANDGSGSGLDADTIDGNEVTDLFSTDFVTDSVLDNSACAALNTIVSNSVAVTSGDILIVESYINGTKKTTDRLAFYLDTSGVTPTQFLTADYFTATDALGYLNAGSGIWKATGTGTVTFSLKCFTDSGNFVVSAAHIKRVFLYKQ
jgi:hypothetical protein